MPSQRQIWPSGPRGFWHPQHGLSAFTAASLAGDVGILQEVQEAAQALLDAPTPESQPLLQLAQARLAALAEEVVGN